MLTVYIEAESKSMSRSIKQAIYIWGSILSHEMEKLAEYILQENYQ